MNTTENFPKPQEEQEQGKEQKPEQKNNFQDDKPRYVQNRHDRRRGAAIARRNKKIGKG